MPLVRQTGQLQPMHGLNPYRGGQAGNFFVRPEALHRQPDAPVSQQCADRPTKSASSAKAREVIAVKPDAG